MRLIYWNILIASFLCQAVWASPFSISIDSEDKIKRIGATIEHQPVEKGGDDDYLSFRISWKPTYETREDIGYRLDLIVHKDNNHNRPTPTKFQGRYYPDDDGFCHADFSLARSEVELAGLAFRGSDQFEYWLSLEDFVEGFPGDEDPVFQIEPLDAEQDGADQPTAAPESKPEGKENTKLESDGRSQ